LFIVDNLIVDMENKIIEWLLELENPSVKYRTLTELLDKTAENETVKEAMQKIPDSTAVQNILDKMHPEGYWLQTNPRTKETLGQEVKYGSFGTTHFCLSYLSELGLNKKNKQVKKAADRYLSLQKDDGDFLNHYSCLLGYNIRTFIKLGYRDDPRVQKSIDLMLNTVRPDGGYLCDMHEGKYKTRPVKSCIRGSVKTLLAFAYLPEYWKHQRCIELVDYFLRRGGIYKSTDLNILVNKDMERNSFPIIWRTNVYEVLYALSRMGFGNDKRLENAWRYMDSRRDEYGRYPLDWTPTQSPWKVGKRGKSNKWITFYSLLAYKYGKIGLYANF
jgi:hypothetical protein